MKVNLEHYKLEVEEALKAYLPKPEGPFKKLYESMAYSVEAGGKRIRPILMKLAFEAVGGVGDIGAYQAALEMVHTYSLVHDDLPAMDNDDLRRGQPTNHIVFGEATAILSGDALLNLAFEVMLEESLCKNSMEGVKAASILAQASGHTGMIAGQIQDMECENQVIDLETLDSIHLHKTGALLGAATKMGAVLGGGSSIEIQALEAFGKYLGKVFQIVDDILDVTATTEALGKPIQSDMKNQKSTYLSFYSASECYEIASNLTEKALKCLEHVSGDTNKLETLAKELIHRKQ